MITGVWAVLLFLLTLVCLIAILVGGLMLIGRAVGAFRRPHRPRRRDDDQPTDPPIIDLTM